MNDLTERLRAMSRHEHDDASIGDEAANEIERLLSERAELVAALRQAVQHADQLASMVNGLAENAGLGRKVHAEDYAEKARLTLAKLGEQ